VKSPLQDTSFRHPSQLSHFAVNALPARPDGTRRDRFIAPFIATREPRPHARRAAKIATPGGPRAP